MSPADLPVRATARLLIVDELNRALLMEIWDNGLSLWVTLGGGVEEGESVHAAARRELWEETGFEAPVGPLIWTGEQVLVRGGVPTQLIENFFLVRVSGEPSRAHWSEDELQAVKEMRWWSSKDIRKSSDVFKPPGLARLLDDLVADLPQAPREISLR